MLAFLKIIFAIIAGSAVLTFLAWFILALFHFIKIYYDAYQVNKKR